MRCALLTAALLVICHTTLPCRAAGKPNFVVILTDDQGYQDLGVFGSPDIRTPNLDSMAGEGRIFTSFYVASPLC